MLALPEDPGVDARKSAQRPPGAAIRGADDVVPGTVPGDGADGEELAHPGDDGWRRPVLAGRPVLGTALPVAAVG